MTDASTTGTGWTTDASGRSRRELLPNGLVSLVSGLARASPAAEADGAPPRIVGWVRRFGRRATGMAAASLALAAALVFAWLVLTTPFARALAPVEARGVVLLDAEGEPFARRGAISAAPVDVTELPTHVSLAFVAIEDRRFFQHEGVDPMATVRATLANVLAGGVREGGSTIAQQLARTRALTRERTVVRKAREALLALWLEARLGKAEVLNRYLSSVYFGDGVYGLRAAARHYFDRAPEDLTIPQAAMLAGLVNAPSRLSPTDNLRDAQVRGRRVLAAMAQAGLIGPAAVERLPDATLSVGPMRDLGRGGWFADWVLGQAPETAREDGRTIATTIDPALQTAAERAVRGIGPAGTEVALVAMRPDGRIVAMVGGRDYQAAAYNRATQARRQPGSAFKLFVYLAAIRRGLTPETLIDDVPIGIGEWEPENHDRRYRGRITLREAFAVSSNSAAVQLAEHVGRERVVMAARDLGLTGQLVTDPSMTLGTSTMTLMDLTAAFAGIADNRFPVRPRGSNEADARWSTWAGPAQQSLTPAEWRRMLDLLWSSANLGTGRAAALGVPTFGKTGTSQDGRDALFIGFAGDLVTGVWIGRDDNGPVPGSSGGGAPARIWRAFMTEALGTSGREPEAIRAFRSRFTREQWTGRGRR